MFRLTIHTKTQAFGEHAHPEAAYQERTEVQAILGRVAHEIGTSAELLSLVDPAGNIINSARKILDSAGNEVGYYEFLSGSAVAKKR